MAYVSLTRPGITRGPHEHKNQTDYFAFVGPGDFNLVVWDDAGKSCHLVGESNPCVVIVPPGVVHAYANVSEVDGLVFNAPNQLYKGAGKSWPADEIRYEGDPRWQI